MPEFCSCGAQLPPDARFCHKCGKPQRDEPHLREEEPEALPPLPIPTPVIAAEPPPIGFQNRTAVWIALRVGILVFLLSAVSGGFALIWLVLGGFVAVYLYRRRTGHSLTVSNGARLGWLAGLFSFVLLTILLTVFVVAMQEPDLVAQVRDQAASRSIDQADMNRMIDLLRTPSGVGAILLMSFLTFSLLPAFGGAMGARLLNRE